MFDIDWVSLEDWPIGETRMIDGESIMRQAEHDIPFSCECCGIETPAFIRVRLSPSLP
jgi:hypothetical protein